LLGAGFPKTFLEIAFTQ